MVDDWHDLRDDIDEWIDLENALSKLPPREQYVLILWGQGYTLREIGKEIDRSRMTAKRLVKSGLDIIREDLCIPKCDKVG